MPQHELVFDFVSIILEGSTEGLAVCGEHCIVPVTFIAAVMLCSIVQYAWQQRTVTQRSRHAVPLCALCTDAISNV